MARPGEFELIARYLAPLASDPAARGLIDDAAVLSPSGDKDLVLTKDALAAGIHFFADDDPGLIARKALRVNISDLAAKGAAPKGYLLALALPSDWTEDWISAFTTGLKADQERYGCSLLGGDTIRSADGLMISITAIGEVPRDKMVPRAGACAGDTIFVSGTIGDAGLGLVLRSGSKTAADFDLPRSDAERLVGRYLLPEPRVALAPVLRDHVRAAMDVSDGLAGDVGHMCRAGGVAAEIRIDDVPLSDPFRRALQADPSLRTRAVRGGDDYEIVCAVAPENEAAFCKAAEKAGIPVAAIGRFTEGAGGGNAPVFVDADGRPVDLGGSSFSHF